MRSGKAMALTLSLLAFAQATAQAAPSWVETAQNETGEQVFDSYPTKAAKTMHAQADPNGAAAAQDGSVMPGDVPRDPSGGFQQQQDGTPYDPSYGDASMQQNQMQNQQNYQQVDPQTMQQNGN